MSSKNLKARIKRLEQELAQAEHDRDHWRELSRLWEARSKKNLRTIQALVATTLN